MTGAIDSATTPVGYFAANRTHDLYSEDIALKGTIQPYKVRAAFVNYPQITSIAPDATANIEFKDPCPDPESVLSALQTNPVDYYFTA